jgi:hypothetical protein
VQHNKTIRDMRKLVSEEAPHSCFPLVQGQTFLTTAKHFTTTPYCICDGLQQKRVEYINVGVQHSTLLTPLGRQEVGFVFVDAKKDHFFGTFGIPGAVARPRTSCLASLPGRAHGRSLSFAVDSAAA